MMIKILMVLLGIIIVPSYSHDLVDEGFSINIPKKWEILEPAESVPGMILRAKDPVARKIKNNDS